MNSARVRDAAVCLCLTPPLSNPFSLLSRSGLPLVEDPQVASPAVLRRHPHPLPKSNAMLFAALRSQPTSSWWTTTATRTRRGSFASAGTGAAPPGAMTGPRTMRRWLQGGGRNNNAGSAQRRAQQPLCKHPQQLRQQQWRPFSEIADRCDLHLIHSPSPPIRPGPYPPIFEFVAQNWSQHQQHGNSNPSEHRKDEWIDPSNVAMIDGSTGVQRTFGDYYRTSTQLAAALRNQFGVDEDECVAMYCPNHVDYLPVTLAVSLLGAKMTPINPLYTTHELEVVLQRSRSSVLVVHNSTLPVALSTVAKCPEVKGVIVINDDGQPVPEGCVELRQLCQEHTSHPVLSTNRVVPPQTPIHPFLLPYSSGTTGLPKGVVLTHENIIANMLQLEEVEGPDFGPSHKLITPLPFFHIYAFTVSMLYCAWKGQTMITTSGRFDLETFCRLVQEHRPHRAHLVPPILLQLSKNPIVDKYDLSSLEMIVSAAAPLSKETEADVLARIGCRVKQAWGMSELSPIGTFNSDSSIRSGSIGPLVASTFGKVVDDHGNSLPPHKPGELCIKGPQVMMGYMDEPDKTAECLSSTGWLRTGDLAYYDEDGYFYISDRLKELIKVRGYPVAPAELESLLLTHPAVGDCAVIQVSCDNSGELPRAYVVLKETTVADNTSGAQERVTEESIYLWVKERVAAYKRLDGGVILCDSIPKSASGKILRRLLRDRAQAERT